MVVPQICLISVPQFSLTKFPIGLGEIIERATDAKVLPKEEALAHRVPACDAGPVHCVPGVVGSCHFLVRSSRLTDLGGEIETRGKKHISHRCALTPVLPELKIGCQLSGGSTSVTSAVGMQKQKDSQ